ncbi:MAG: phosphate ABC transporter permease PstA [SAR324 cluster bacterium]|nr:phosphate ABC transporter permease PstA [SAR324 cluster bacterium]
MGDYKKASNKAIGRENFGIYFTGGALLLILLVVCYVMVIVLVNGLGVFWQKPLVEWHLKGGETLLGYENQRDVNSAGQDIVQIKIANRDIVGSDYKWIKLANVLTQNLPENALLVERYEYGDFFGYLGNSKIDSKNKLAELKDKITQLDSKSERLTNLTDEINKLDLKVFNNNNLIKSLTYEGAENASPELTLLRNENETLIGLIGNIAQKKNKILALNSQLNITLKLANGKDFILPIEKILHFNFPNQMGLVDKVGDYLRKLWRLLSEEPREANTEGGIFPAIFGTIIMVFLMSILSFPLGVITAIYLQEYAKRGWLLSVVRISVNNLAGVPSIVYGIFGLGFFIYGIGGFIDQTFFSEFLPTPTFGTGGILWASLTLGLLTAPVVIVSTEEALATIPQGVRESSLALGATKFQTVLKVVLPLASPGMLTGFILAMARAAGEVAPLMITGVVKLAPSLPIDGEFPFIHLNRKFMHLGFHIFDVGFQSPNVEASRAMVYMTTLLLLFIVILMVSIAIYIRSRMIEKYSTSSI